MMFDKERLHPATIILNVFKLLKDMIFFILLSFVAMDFLYFLLVLALFLIVVAVIGTISWYRYTYWVDEDALHMEYGVFKRTKRTISKNRIQSIDLTENVVHRIFKLVRVQIETASIGAQAEASLAAVTLQRGKDLRANLKYKKMVDEDVQEETEEEKPVVKKEISFKRLLFAGVTSGGVGLILSFVIVGLLEMPEQFYDYTMEWFVSTSILTILLLVVVILIIVWLLSVGLMLIRYGKFTIKLTEDELLITRGLLERKQLTIPLHRIQAVSIEENILRQPFNYASIVAEIAGGSSDKQADTSVILFPMMHRNEISAFLAEFVPGFSWQPEQMKWIKPPKQARKFYIFRSGIFFFLASIAVFYFLPAYSWVALLILGLFLYRGWMCYQDAGFHVEGDRLFLRFRLFKRVTAILYHKRIQAFAKKQQPLQRKNQLATMKLSIISSAGGKHYRVKDLKEENVDGLSELFFSKKNTTQQALDNRPER